MFRFIIKLFFCLILILPKSNAETLNSVEVIGNKRISKETIMVLSDLTINENLDMSSINEKLKKLYDSDFFSDVNMQFDDGKLRIYLIENPIIEELKINGIKKNSMLDFITSNLRLKNRMSYSETLLNYDIDKIYNILKTNGYYFSKINSSLVKNDQLNSIKIIIDIDLGKKAKIKEIIFLGDKKIKDKKLLEIITSEEHKFWKLISNKSYLNKSIIDLDKRLLENFYKNQGYYNVKILDSYAELNDIGSFKLIFNIDSGSQFFFNDLSIELPDDYNQNDFNKVKKIFDELKNEKYSLNKINKILSEIEYIATLKLYDFIKADVNVEIIDNNKLDFTFTVSDSEKFYVNRINIFGNYNTIEEVIRNKLIVDEGDPFNELLFTKSINEIRSLNIFKNVDAQVINDTEENLKTLNITVEEKPTGEISVGAGYGTTGGVLAGSIIEKNFLGKGITLNSDLELSSQGIKGSITYSKPNFNYSDNTLFTSIKSKSTDNLSNYGYKANDVGFSIGTRFEQFENLYFSPEIDLSFEDLETNDNASTSLKKQEGSYQDIYFNYNLEYDLRNSSNNPTSGYRTDFKQQLPMISNNYELTNTFVATKYQILNANSDMIGKASLYLKNVNSLNGNDVRVSKRASIPYNRLRGFEKGKVGPVDNSDYVGGNNVFALNFSTNLPNIFPTLENIDFNYFVDVANVWGIDYDSSIDDSSYFRSSTGIGLDFLTPIGPLSFSLSQPITKKSSDKTETFRFNLGTSF